MKKTILYTILLISISFNAAFIVSTIVHIKNRPPFPGPPDGFEFKDHHRPPRFDKMMEEGKDEARKRMLSYRKQKREFMEELVSEDFSPEKAREIFQQGINIQMEMEKSIGEHLIKIRSEMTAEQAKEFFKKRIKEKIRDNKNTRRNRK
eukprot:Anaeramoba_ignava/a479150_33.p3 GENE.a479150_33~~a479150_33.p3  ORF type:complete len:149 (-),score=14.47 a479150_33:499-945(-)